MSSSILSLSNICNTENNNNNFTINTQFYSEEQLKQVCSEIFITETVQHRISILNDLYLHHRKLCLEQYQKLKLQYLYNPLIEINEETLIKIVKESIIPIELKYECAKLIYNEHNERNKDSDNDSNLGYELFACILNISNNKHSKNTSNYVNNTVVQLLVSVDVYGIPMLEKKHNILHTLIRLEIIQFLSETCKYKLEVELFILQYLNDRTIYEFERYKSMLKIAENPKTKPNYVHYIFRTICLSNILSTRYVILGAQCIFNNEIFSIEDKLEIEQKIIRICQDNMLYYNTRADAADFLLTTVGVTEESRQIARDVIILLGRDNNIINRNGNIYNNRQNIHNKDIDDSVKNIMKKIMNMELKDDNIENKKEITYVNMSNEIIKLFCKQNNIELSEQNLNINNIEDKNETPIQITTEDDYIITKEPIKQIDENIVQLNAIKSSLGRFQLDRTMYSDVPRTQTLFVKVWTIINNHEHKDELTKRLFEELIDMNGTCSTGHTSRLVNIFSGFELNGELIRLNIDCKSEMTEVTMAKINKRIQDLSSSDKPEDEKYQSDLMDEMMWNSNFENRVNLNRFIRENIMSIREELYKDYVTDQKLINEETFEINFRLILHKFDY
jgi:hypothetical protein